MSHEAPWNRLTTFLRWNDFVKQFAISSMYIVQVCIGLPQHSLFGNLTVRMNFRMFYAIPLRILACFMQFLLVQPITRLLNMFNWWYNCARSCTGKWLLCSQNDRSDIFLSVYSTLELIQSKISKNISRNFFYFSWKYWQPCVLGRLSQWNWSRFGFFIDSPVNRVGLFFTSFSLLLIGILKL